MTHEKETIERVESAIAEASEAVHTAIEEAVETVEAAVEEAVEPSEGPSSNETLVETKYAYADVADTHTLAGKQLPYRNPGDSIEYTEEMNGREIIHAYVATDVDGEIKYLFNAIPHGGTRRYS